LTFRLIDESERVRALAQRAFDPNSKDRPAGVIQLREFSLPVCDKAESVLGIYGDPAAAIDAAVEEYRRQRQLAVEYRRRRGLPTEE